MHPHRDDPSVTIWVDGPLDHDGDPVISPEFPPGYDAFLAARSAFFHNLPLTDGPSTRTGTVVDDASG
jgi:hypothetical protein